VTLAYVAFGANLGDGEATFARAAQALAARPGVSEVRRSSLWHTAPVGNQDQPWFVNGCYEVRFREGEVPTPRRWLEELLAVEASLGRDRRGETPGGPRRCDLDLLLFGDLTVDEPGLTIPHPRLHERAFALAPLVELAGPHLAIPGRGEAGVLLEHVYNFRTCRRAGRSG
jgi:2-amino-4-hydroxy-6-hydroxymethyldihydropteridine diphosphokinase